MDKKIFSVMLLLLVLVKISFAMSPVAFSPPFYENRDKGTNQYYSVLFDGEGEAAVAAKLTFQNLGTEAFKELKIEIPGEVRLINTVQEIQKVEKVCNYTRKVCDETNTNFDKICPENSDCILLPSNNCKEVCDSWTDQYTSNYLTLEKSEVLRQGAKEITIKLIDLIKPQETGTIILYYKVKGYTSNVLGVYDFDFQTIKTNHDTNQVRVSINVDNDLILKEGNSKVNYQPDFGGFETSLAAESSEKMSVYSRNIEIQDGFVKTAKELDPLENLHVKGTYSGSWLLLNFWKVTITSILVLLSLVFVAKQVKKLRSKKIKQNVFSEVPLTSLLSGISITLLWYLGMKSIEWLSFLFYHNSGIWIALLVITGFAMLVTIAITPAIYFGQKYGLLTGAINLIITLFLTAVLSLILGLLLGGNPVMID